MSGRDVAGRARRAEQKPPRTHPPSRSGSAARSQGEPRGVEALGQKIKAVSAFVVEQLNSLEQATDSRLELIEQRLSFVDAFVHDERRAAPAPPVKELTALEQRVQRAAREEVTGMLRDFRQDVLGTELAAALAGFSGASGNTLAAICGREAEAAAKAAVTDGRLAALEEAVAAGAHRTCACQLHPAGLLTVALRQPRSRRASARRVTLGWRRSWRSCASGCCCWATTPGLVARPTRRRRRWQRWRRRWRRRWRTRKRGRWRRKSAGSSPPGWTGWRRCAAQRLGFHAARSR